MTNHYDARNIQVLEGLDAVRMRPGMYIGSTGSRGLHHMLWEIVDNSIDEAMSGFATRVDVTLGRDGSVTVQDNSPFGAISCWWRQVTRVFRAVRGVDSRTSVNLRPSSNSPAWCRARQATPPGSRKVVVPSRRLSASPVTVILAIPGVSLTTAPGRVCQSQAVSAETGR